MPPHQQGPIPAWVWAVLGAVAAAAVLALLAALWLRLPAPLKQALPSPTGQRLLPLDLPELPPYYPLSVSATELPPAMEVTATVPVAAPPIGISPATPVPVSVPSLSANTTSTSNPYPQGHGKLAVVIDDMGIEARLSARAIATLPSPVTFAFMVEAPATLALANQAKQQGHSIIVHLPMEPQPHPEGTPPLGPYGVTVAMDSPTLLKQTQANLEPLSGLQEGVNNHMGSRFTQWEAGMQEVLKEVAAQNLYFLDSRTAAPTATKAAAQGLNIKLATRDVFLDHTATEAAIRAELLRAVKLTQKRKLPVVVIGHPLPATLAVLEADLPLLEAAGITLVPLRAAVN